MTPAEALLHRGPGVLAAAGEVGSPCVSVCRMGPDGLCEGCLRSIDEIAGWSRQDDAARRAVWARVLERAQAAIA